MAELNLPKLISYGIHGPHIKLNEASIEIHKQQGLDDLFPLYARLDRKGYDKRSPQWLQAIELNYNSPRNIKSLSISSTGIVSRTHCGVGKDNRTEFTRRYTSTPRSLRPKLPVEYLTQRLQGIQQGYGDTFILSNPWQALSGDWALNNLEMLCIDATMFLHLEPRVTQYLLTTGSRLIAKVKNEADREAYLNDYIEPYKISECINAQAGSDEEVCLYLYKLVGSQLAKFVGKTAHATKHGIPGYPRLKYIVFADFGVGRKALTSGEQDWYNESAEQWDTFISERNLHSISWLLNNYLIFHPDRLKNTNIQHTSQLNNSGILASHLQKAICIDTGIDLVNADFSTTKVWKYDADKLIAYRELLAKRKYDRVPRPESTQEQAQQEQQETVQYEPPKQSQETNYQLKLAQQLDLKAENEYERLLNRSLLVNPKIAQGMLMTAVDISGEQEILSIINSFTPKGKQTYLRLLQLGKKGGNK